MFLLATPAAGQTTLRWRFTPGERLRLSISQTGATEAAIGGENYATSLNVGARLDWRVADIGADGAAVIEQTLSQLTVASELPGAEPLRYDSAAQEPPAGAAKAIAGEFRPLLGRPVRVRLTPQGKIESADVRGNRRKAGQANAPLTAGAVEQILGRLLPPLPQKAVAPGDSWREEREVETAQGKIRIEGEFVYRGQESDAGRNVEKIEANFTFTSAPQDQEVALAFQDQNNPAVFYFDSQAGRLVRSEVRQAMTLQLTVGETPVSQKVASVMRIEVLAAE